MSVHTKVEAFAIKQLLAHYTLGELIDYSGIKEGVTNTNYRVQTTQGWYILTLFEQHAASELDVFLKLTPYLSENGLLSPATIADKDGNYLHTVANKPAAIIQFLAGQCIDTPNIEQCHALGVGMAQLHLLGQQFPKPWPVDSRGPDWRKHCSQQLESVLANDDLALLQDEIAFQQQDWPLPKGLIHADAFRDNVLFDGNKLSGIIDFYYACKGYFLYDLAIIVNDWCINSDGSIDQPRFDALLKGYESKRPLSEPEQNHWQPMLRCAALRFWLSRLYDWHFVADDPLIQKKDPGYFKGLILRQTTR